jgi:hypothetical protein
VSAVAASSSQGAHWVPCSSSAALLVPLERNDGEVSVFSVVSETDW